MTLCSDGVRNLYEGIQKKNRMSHLAFEPVIAIFEPSLPLQCTFTHIKGIQRLICNRKVWFFPYSHSVIFQQIEFPSLHLPPPLILWIHIANPTWSWEIFVFISQYACEFSQVSTEFADPVMRRKGVNIMFFLLIKKKILLLLCFSLNSENS